MPGTVASAADLATIIQAYNGVTERLKRSHEALAREVCRLREELHAKNKELQRRERLAALGEMAAGLAHEIRNPLGGIGLYASLLERDLADCPAPLEIVRKISSAIQSMDSIVCDILAFAGDAEPNPQPVWAANILRGVLEQAEPKADALGIRIETDSALEAVKLHCDAAQTERALVNLVMNAVDAAGSDGKVWIRRDDRRGRNGMCGIVVDDDGRGIATELLHRVFDPFFTTKDTGTGLGLAIVHRIAESNGGAVSAGHRKGGGASFVLSVPLARENQEHETPAGGDE